MPKKESEIKYEDVRPLGIGRMTACLDSTSGKPGLLIGSVKGLYYLEHPESRPKRIRRYPVGYLVSGDSGVVCYEEVSGHGRLAILDGNLEETHVDESLAREINPKAYWNDGLIILHKAKLVHLDFKSGARRILAEIAPTRVVGPFAGVGDGYEFIAVLRGDQWPTWLYRLDLSAGKETGTDLIGLGQAEDPIIARIFIPLPNGDYFVVHQGRLFFQTYRLFHGEKAGFRTWTLVAITGGAHPVGAVLFKRKLYMAGADCLITFRLADEMLSPGR